VARPLTAASPDAAGSVRLQLRAVAGGTEQTATAYQAQGPGGWFKPRNPESPAIPAGYRAVPAQVMLGIAAQETNMSQASWHEVPGDTGNPLVAG